MTTPDRAAFPAGCVTRYTTDDFDDMARRMPAWGHECHKVQAGNFQGRLRVAHTTRLQSSEQYFSRGMAMSGHLPPDCWSFVLPLEGRAHGHMRGTSIPADTLCALRAGEDMDWIFTGPLRWMIVSVDAARVGAFIRTHKRDFLEPWMSEGQLALISGGTARLAALWRELDRRVMDRPELLADPDPALRVEDAYLEAIMTSAAQDIPRPRISQRTRIARSARDYLRRQRHHPVGIDELCDAVGVPERTLHLAFRESYGMPPRKYMKLLRLNSARHALLQADAPITVSQVAMDWGFLHLGRFAVDYHALFGQPPSETLACRANRARPAQTITDDRAPYTGRSNAFTQGGAPSHPNTLTTRESIGLV
jgi:AraC family ethanolamine operon transcriptional activator